tara:strand:- start:658 stop:1308 length:651 start_codon:yes stop_codon:yes gene_type:complete
MLPFKKAIKLPIIFKRKTRFNNLKGQLIINGEISRGMIIIGDYHSDLLTPLFNIIDIKGKIIFNGPVQIGCGTLIRVEKNGILEFGNKNVIGGNSKIFCENSIKIEDYTRVGWECQLFDTNFHYLKNTKDNTYIDKLGSITLGKNNWIGNRTSIMKNTCTPDYTIVASNSICNKDYVKSNVKPESVIGGCPAELIALNKIRVFDRSEELKIENIFS